MASSFEKSVKGATKIKAAPPKTKYIEHILVATHSGEHGVADVFRALQSRLRDSTWTVVFKSLITVHLMIREGAPDVTLEYLSRHRNMLAIGSFSDVQTQGRNIRHYTNYLTERAKAYRDVKCDWVRAAEHRLEKMPVDKGLLRETEIVQHQIIALLKCDVLDNEPENEITITVFRMLVLDLLALFHVVNQAMINILGHFFEMSRSDAERALKIYTDFTRQTDFVVSYLSIARQYQHQTRVDIPKLKHAPVNLAKQLEDYLADPDFEINRRQYLAEQEAKKNKGANGPTKAFSKSMPSDGETRATDKTFPSVSSSQPAGKPAQQQKGKDQDLIDFFEPIEQSQQPLAAQHMQQQQTNIPNFEGASQYQAQETSQFQQNGFGAQPATFQDPNQFQPSVQPPFMQQQHNLQGQTGQQMHPNFTGAGFGGYTPQPSFQPATLPSIPQESTASFPSQGAQTFVTGQQTTNPFRISIMSSTPSGLPGPSFTASPPIISPAAPQSTNPFKSFSQVQQSKQFNAPTPQSQQLQQGTPTSSPPQSSTTGTNPFARNTNQSTLQRPATSGTFISQPTGSTNPFRQPQFGAGPGWQNNQQPIGGGLDNLETIPIFPRPTQQQTWQQ